MTDHAGPRRCECNHGTKFWHPPVEVTQFWLPRSGFCNAKKDYIDQKAGKRIKQKLLEMVQVTVLLIYFCLIFQKRKRTAKPLFGCNN